MTAAAVQQSKQSPTLAASHLGDEMTRYKVGQEVSAAPVLPDFRMGVGRCLGGERLGVA